MGLHPTGNIQRALHNAALLVADSGHLMVAIYNQHWSSPIWRFIEWFFNKSPEPTRKLPIWVFFLVTLFMKWLVTRQDPKIKRHGMDFYYDLIDWIGVYPYKYANPERIRSIASDLGFDRLRLIQPKVPTVSNELEFAKL